MKKIILAALIALFVLLSLPTPTYRPILSPLAVEPENKGKIPNIWQLTLDFAHIYGVEPQLAICILMNESMGDRNAVGDGGKAVGAWQFHLSTWKSFRRQMGLSERDARSCPVESTKTAMWAIGQKGYGPHWSPFFRCGGVR